MEDVIIHFLIYKIESYAHQNIEQTNTHQQQHQPGNLQPAKLINPHKSIQNGRLVILEHETSIKTRGTDVGSSEVIERIGAQVDERAIVNIYPEELFPEDREGYLQRIE